MSPLCPPGREHRPAPIQDKLALHQSLRLVRGIRARHKIIHKKTIWSPASCPPLCSSSTLAGWGWQDGDGISRVNQERPLSNCLTQSQTWPCLFNSDLKNKIVDILALIGFIGGVMNISGMVWIAGIFHRDACDPQAYISTELFR